MLVNKGPLIAMSVMMGEKGPEMSDAEMLMLARRLHEQSKVAAAFHITVGVTIIVAALAMAAIGFWLWLSR